ncbi:MAG: phosphomannomutase/phosphoglucomutase [bacterium]
MAFQCANTLPPLDAVDDVIDKPPQPIRVAATTPQPALSPNRQVRSLPLRPINGDNGDSTHTTYFNPQLLSYQAHFRLEQPTNDATAVLCDEIFREYDIRGAYPQQLDPKTAYYIGLSIGSALRSASAQAKPQASQTTKDTTCLVGRDGRLSSPMLAQALIQGLNQSGCAVIDLGLIPTPLMYFALRHYDLDHALMVTGSHNPADDNGIKIVLEQSCQYGAQIQAIQQRIQQQHFVYAPQQASYQQWHLLTHYINHLSSAVRLKRPMRIAIDCGNGVAGLVAEPLFRQLGCETHLLFTDVDGRFPNHSPDPTVPENLQALKTVVREQRLELGIAFDGDADRMIAVYPDPDDAETVHILWPDRILMLFAQAILPHYPHAYALYDVKCSHLVAPAIEQAGGRAKMVVSGHSLLKAAMATHQAVLGGEFSGHLILADNDRNKPYADDGLYAAVRLLALLSESSTTSHPLQQFPTTYSTPEVRYVFASPHLAKQVMRDYAQCLQEHPDLAAAKHSLMDGFRVDFADAWGLARASNTSASITCRFEANQAARLKELQGIFLSVLHHCLQAFALISEDLIERSEDHPDQYWQHPTMVFGA